MLYRFFQKGVFEQTIIHFIMNCVFYDTLRKEKIAKGKNTEEKNMELKNANIGQIRIL